MAIQPIDLQALFSQVDKVGKVQSAQHEGQMAQQAIHGAHLQRKTEEHIREVNEAQNTGDGIDKVNENEERGNRRGGGKGGNNPKGEDENGEEQVSVFRDPLLGKNIDISL